jgi:NADH-quinone oxidoreductase subunit L
MSALLLAIPLLPLGVSALLFVSGAFISGREDRGAERWRSLAGWLSVGGVLASTVLSLVLFFAVRGGQEVSFSWTWFRAGELEVPLSMSYTGLQAVMAVVVTGVSTLVHLFSNGYMAGERNYLLYFAELSLFSGAMLLLVLADNFFLLYVGWELVGASSYLLISFYYERPSAAAAGKKAFLTTRLGDIGLLIGILAIIWQTGSVQFEEVFAQAEAGAFGEVWTVAIPLLLFAGAVGKSAQFPLHVWLPDAMEGPTPVSALIHAATMVAAGVYLVARAFPLFEAAPAALTVVAWIGAVTALGAATIGVAQRDIKRVLAYSTISQLGFMMVALGVRAPEAGIFHLFTHAWFKALLFLGAGSVIHATGRQFVDELGGLGRILPVTAWTFTIAALALAGIPPFAGFWSKEEILVSLVDGNLALFMMLVLATFLTAFYIFRLVFLVFFGPSPAAPGARAAAAAVAPAPVEIEGGRHGPAEEHTRPDIHERPVFEGFAGRGPGRAEKPVSELPAAEEDAYVAHQEGPVHESGPVMSLPLLVLAVAAVLAGFLGASFFGYPLQDFLALGGEHHEVSLWVTLLAVAVGLAGIALAWALYGRGDVRARGDVLLRRGMGGFYQWLAAGYRLDGLYDRVLIRPFVGASSFFWRTVDDRVIDGSVNFVARSTAWFGGLTRRAQHGIVRDYVAVMAVGALVVIAVIWRVL